MGNTIQREATVKDAIKTGLTKDEFEKIKDILGRTPTTTETSIYGILWSEESSQKSAIKWLNTLPKANENNSSEIIIGKSMNFTFKANSYNKVNFTKEESYINSTRTDLIAQINALCFGDLENKNANTVAKEITKEISDFGNENKIPTIKGEVTFNESFNNTPLINTFSVGIADAKKKDAYDFDSEKILKSISDLLKVDVKEIRVVNDAKKLSYFIKEELIAEIPTDSVTIGKGTPVYEREIAEPAYFKEFKSLSLNDIKEPDDLKEVAAFLLKRPNIASKRWINDQFNATRRTGAKTILSDAGVVEVKESGQALTLTVNCNPRYVYADPEIGTSIAVAEAARNIICSGGEPKAVSTCLNFGNPENPEVVWQFTNAIKGMKTVCEKFKTPVAGKSISFNNQSEIDGKEVSILPTPTIGMIGLLEDKAKAMSLDFKTKGDLIFIIGEAVECIAGSEYLHAYHGVSESPAPYFNLNMEYEMQQVIKSLIKKGLVNAAHDCSLGGIFITLAEMAMPNELGFDIVTDAEIREDAFLFGEASGRVLVGVNEENEDGFIEFMMNSGVNFTLLGHVTQGKMVVDDDHFGFIQEAKKSYDKALGDLIDF